MALCLHTLQDGDTIMTYAYSSVVAATLLAAHKVGVGGSMKNRGHASSSAARSFHQEDCLSRQPCRSR